MTRPVTHDIADCCAREHGYLRTMHKLWTEAMKAETPDGAEELLDGFMATRAELAAFRQVKG